MSPQLPIAILLGSAVAVGFMLGGSLRRFESVPFHWWGLAVAGLALQVIPIPSFLTGEARVIAGPLILVASYAALLGFVTVNRWLPGAAAMALGLLLNLAVVVANSGMPVSPAAVRAAGGPDVVTIQGPRHVLMTDATKLRPLGDVVPVPPFRLALSPGDLLLYGGVAWFMIAVMLGRSRANPRPLAPWLSSYRGKHAPAHWRLPARYRTDRSDQSPAGAPRGS
jgi:hypothetical protein